MTEKLVSDLADRLYNACRYTPNNTDRIFVKERWELVADTIDLMIRKAILESENRRIPPTKEPPK